MKTVAVTQRVDVYPDRNETRDAIDQRLIQFLLNCGYMPTVVPNVLQNTEARHDSLDEWIAVTSFRALVLSGGNDIGEFPGRDETEQRLLDYAEAKRLPVLGLCRGMQMIASRAGVDLVVRPGHVRTYHNLRGEIVAKVNSYHDKVLADCPVNFVVTARSEDDSIEAIRHQNLPWEGWMWHPERETDFSIDDICRLQDLFGD